MQDSAGTSDSAASSGGSSSQPASSGDDSHGIGGDTLRVDFYVLEEASSAGRLKLACRLAEKAYLAAQVALVWHTHLSMRVAFKIQTFIMKLPTRDVLPARGGVGFPLSKEEMRWHLNYFNIAA